MQRLPNGNTFICEAPRGHLFEVTPDGQTVWTYQVDGARAQVARAMRYPVDYPGLSRLRK